MTIRSGGRARDPQARPAATGTYDEAWQPEYLEETHGPGGGRGGGYYGGYNGRNGGRRGIPGIVKFLAFALVLAAIVLLVLVTVLRPLVKGAVLGWATDNPAALGMPFVADLVREDLGDKLTTSASTDRTQVPFTVADGETASSIAGRLEDDGFLADRRAFVFIATERQLTGDLQTGTFILRRLDDARPARHGTARSRAGPLRSGRTPDRSAAGADHRELETIDGLQLKAADFYHLATHPTPACSRPIRGSRRACREGASLEGFLWPANYQILPDTTAEELIRRCSTDSTRPSGSDDKSPAPAACLLSDPDTGLDGRARGGPDADRPLIAGVFMNRMDPKLFPNLHLGSDPTIFYIHDTLQLDPANVPSWTSYVFWASFPAGYQLPAELPDDLAAYNTYTHQGLHPGPDLHADAAVDRRRPEAEHQGSLPVLPGQEGRVGRHRLREDAQGAPGKHQEVRLMPDSPASGNGLPTPADFAAPPTEHDRGRWRDSDRQARPQRVARLRARFAAAGVDAYFGIRPEHSRYLTGFVLADGEEKVAGTSGSFLIGGEEIVLLADSRYAIQARSEAPDARVVDGPRDLAQRMADTRRVGRRATNRRRGSADPVRGLAEARGCRAGRRARTGRGLARDGPSDQGAGGDRARRRGMRGRRSSARGCAAAGGPGATEHELALDLEWRMRTGGAEARRLRRRCLVGPNAALPHGSPSDASVRSGAVVLFDFGAQVDGYRSDMTRTLFVGEPAARDLAIHELVAQAQSTADRRIQATVDGELTLPSGRDLDAIARRGDRDRRSLAGRSSTASDTGSAWQPTSCRR